MALSKVDLANQVENVLPEDNGGTGRATLPNSFRNIIINGDMSIAQRGTSVTGITTGAYHTVDRIITQISSAGTWTQSQSTDVPSGEGFSNSFKMDCTTADSSLSAGDYLILNQRIEGQNLQYLKKGTSNAQSLTLSFWVKSAKTGTYICELWDNDNNRTISKSYTIDTADTWEKKIITFAGDTTGTFGNDNGLSLYLNFWLAGGTTFTSGTLATSWESRTNANRAVGNVNLADSTSNNWYITGVQLEAGTVASDFEFLPYDVNYARCIRYYHKVDDYYMGVTFNSSDGYASFYQSPVGMRGDIALESGGSYSVNGGSAGTPAIRTGAWQGQERVNFYNSASNWSSGALLEFSGAVSSEL